MSERYREVQSSDHLAIAGKTWRYAPVVNQDNVAVYGWRADKFKGAAILILKWEKRYPNEPEKVRFLVENALLDTNSPGRKEAFRLWLDHNKPEREEIDNA